MRRSSASYRTAHLVGGMLAVAYASLLIGTAPDLALSRDESFYVQASRDYGNWFAQLASTPRAALERTVIDRAWDYNWEHPPLIKSASALAVRLQRATKLFRQESTAFRLPGILCASALLWLLCVWGARVRSLIAGMAAALSFALMPRVFYHSHLHAFDVPIAFFGALTAYTYWRALRDPRWSWAAGLVFGLALATKHNAWILPGIFAVHTVYLWWRERDVADNWQSALWRRGARAIVAMSVIGPTVLFALWPWLWNDTWTRLARYVVFHLKHVHYTYAFLGVSYFRPPFPVSVPFVMTLFTVPFTTIVLAVWGVLSRARNAPTREAVARDAAVHVLWFGCMVAPLLAIALPSTPIFGGTKHWITAYPFLALFAGMGVAQFVDIARAKLPTPAVGLAVALLASPAVVQTAHSHPFGLSHYTVAAGGVPGAADLGMNRQFWGFTTGSLIPWLEKQLPHGGTVWLCDTTLGAWVQLQRDGRVPKTLRATHSIDAADVILVHHEDHFAEVEHQAWMVTRGASPAFVLQYDGVPIISAYVPGASDSRGSRGAARSR